MTPAALKSYTKLVGFLGQVFGPTYEFALFDKVDDHYALVAISNNNVTGRELGSPISPDARELLKKEDLAKGDYLVHYKNHGINGKLLRASTYFIRDNAGEVTGLLCVNFDDTRYREVSELLLGLCHPDAYVDSSFLVDSEHMRRADSAADSEYVMMPADITAEEMVQRILTLIGADPNNLTARDKLRVVRELEKQGAFLRRGTVQAVCSSLNISQATAYRYLAQVKNEK